LGTWSITVRDANSVTPIVFGSADLDNIAVVVGVGLGAISTGTAYFDATMTALGPATIEMSLDRGTPNGNDCPTFSTIIPFNTETIPRRDVDTCPVSCNSGSFWPNVQLTRYSPDEVHVRFSSSVIFGLGCANVQAWVTFSSDADPLFSHAEEVHEAIVADIEVIIPAALSPGTTALTMRYFVGPTLPITDAYGNPVIWVPPACPLMHIRAPFDIGSLPIYIPN